ncbi:MAG TPA: hypothetical protein VGP93_13030, partial [Polyangiaceae bacterium]|nr:hypothetical protein [Polyangiaceae bacterium]
RFANQGRLMEAAVSLSAGEQRLDQMRVWLPIEEQHALDSMRRRASEGLAAGRIAYIERRRRLKSFAETRKVGRSRVSSDAGQRTGR